MARNWACGIYPTQRQVDAAMDDFAELLSLDRYSLPEIARLMGVTQGTVLVLLRMLREWAGEGVG